MGVTLTQHHPDRELTNFILDCIRFGFRIGVASEADLVSARANLPSVKGHSSIVEAYIELRRAKNWTSAGPIFTKHHARSACKSHWESFPKNHKARKWRLITDLSYPEGHSVNDAIPSDLCTLQYIAVDQVAQAVIQLGRGAQLAKTDIKAAYRLMRVHPQDRVKLGFKFNDVDLLYVDGCLPFGLRSAPKLFNALADALEWCISRQGVTRSHICTPLLGRLRCSRTS